MMGRFGFQPADDLYVCVSTHGYYYIKRDGNVIKDGKLTDMGIKYNKHIDDLDDPRIDESAEDGGWADVYILVRRFLEVQGII